MVISYVHTIIVLPDRVASDVLSIVWNARPMPPRDTILEGLTLIANSWKPLAMGWHAVVVIVVIAIGVGWRPTNRTAAAMSVLPFVSVSALAWTFANPFNGTVFALLAVLLSGVVLRAPAERCRRSSPPLLVCGAALVGFGWVYPHFLEVTDWRSYLYAAPLGLIPCPTLALALGTTLMIDGHISNPWAFTLSTVGLVYGVIGLFVLAVRLDTVLLAGAAVLAASASRRRARPALEIVRTSPAASS